MTSVVGYEGRRAADAVASWGAAAVERDGQLINGVTGHTLAAGDGVLANLAARGRLTLFNLALELPARARVPEIVFQCQRSFFEEWRLGTYIDDSLILDYHAQAGDDDKRWTTIVFKKKSSFTMFREHCAAALAHILLYPDGEPVQTKKVLSAGLVLSAHHPVLNAFRAWQEPNDATWAKMCRASVQTEGGQSTFDDIIEGWRAADNKDRWALYYKSKDNAVKGIASEDALNLFGALVKVNTVYSATLKRDYPFLKKPPANHFDRFEAASARFEFISATVKSSPGEQVARFLETRMLQRALDGNLPPDPKPELTEAIAVIARPPQYTEVEQKPMGEVSLRPILQTELVPDAQLPKPTWASSSERMTLLGYHSGTMDDAKKTQLTLSPDCWRTVHRDEETRGADDFRNARRTLYLPVVFEVVREVSSRGTYSYRLKSIELLGVEARQVTALPSQLVRDAFLLDCKVKVSFAKAEGVLHVDATTLSIGTVPTIDRAHEWMRRFGDLCTGRELGWTGRRLSPVVVRGVEKQDRALLALRELKGTATIVQVVEWLEDKYRHALDVEAWLSRPLRSSYVTVEAGNVSWTEQGHARADALFRLTSSADQSRSFY